MDLDYLVKRRRLLVKFADRFTIEVELSDLHEEFVKGIFAVRLVLCSFDTLAFVFYIFFMLRIRISFVMIDAFQFQFYFMCM